MVSFHNGNRDHLFSVTEYFFAYSQSFLICHFLNIQNAQNYNKLLQSSLANCVWYNSLGGYISIWSFSILRWPIHLTCIKHMRRKYYCSFTYTPIKEELYIINNYTCIPNPFNAFPYHWLRELFSHSCWNKIYIAHTL